MHVCFHCWELDYFFGTYSAFIFIEYTDFLRLKRFILSPRKYTIKSISCVILWHRCLKN
eukprot:UN34355